MWYGLIQNSRDLVACCRPLDPHKMPKIVFLCVFIRLNIPSLEYICCTKGCNVYATFYSFSLINQNIINQYSESMKYFNK